jgi:hypothetical protein
MSRASRPANSRGFFPLTPCPVLVCVAMDRCRRGSSNYGEVGASSADIWPATVTHIAKWQCGSLNCNLFVSITSDMRADPHCQIANVARWVQRSSPPAPTDTSCRRTSGTELAFGKPVRGAAMVPVTNRKANANLTISSIAQKEPACNSPHPGRRRPCGSGAEFENRIEQGRQRP